LYFDRKDGGKIAHDGSSGVAGIGRGVDLAVIGREMLRIALDGDSDGTT
jgi:hypothetical protein